MPVHNCDDHYLTMTDGSGRCGICGRHSSKSEMDAAYYRKQRAEIDRLKALLREAFTAGMLVGHHHTVAGTMPSDASEREEEAACWLHENGIVVRGDSPNAHDQPRP
jgi:hypothetical protein